MYNHTNTAYRHNPLMDSTSKQISFLFGRMIYFIEEADRLRNEQHYQEFAYQNQRAIAVIHGLSSIMQSELNPKTALAWDYYFLSLLRDLNTHMIEPDPVVFKKLCDNIRCMEQTLRNVDIQNQIVINPNINTDHNANDNCILPPNHNQITQTDLNISI